MRAPILACLLTLAAGLAACGTDPTPPPAVPDGNPDRGIELIEEFGCGGCHVIPGIEGADGQVGPPLTEFGDRSLIAGSVPNNAENLVEWLLDPQDIEPGTAMPDLGLSEDQARDVAAYLFTLRR